MDIPCDLHLHTTCSDGAFAPRDVVCRVQAKGLSIMAITDHDTVAGVSEGIQAAAERGITCLSGVELSTFWDQEIHVLGYNVPHQDEQFLQEIGRLQTLRQARVEQIVAKLHRHGVKVRPDERLQQPSAGRSHIAALLVEQGYVRTKAEAFDKYLGKGAPCYVEGMRLDPVEAVRLLRDAGAVPVLAHPFRMLQAATLPDLVERLVPAGLAGIEVYYPNYSRTVRAQLRGIALRHGLICTGGSDFHSVEWGAEVGEAEAFLDDNAAQLLLH